MNAPTTTLETSLLHAWDPDELAVYADHLLSGDDLHGQLIAIDLRPRPGDATWLQQRRALLARWIGADLAWRAGHLVQHGFLHELRTGSFPPALLDSPAGTYLRGFTVFGRDVRDALVQLAARPRPWLTRLVIASTSYEYLAPDEIRALVAATPRLAELHLLGRPPWWSFHHRALQHVYLAREFERVELSAEVTLVDTPPRATGPAVTAGEVARLGARVAEVEDCNALYADTSFTQPVAALVARLAAAGLVELRGPIVRCTPRAATVELPGPAVATGFLATCPGHVLLPELETHVALIRACAYRYPLSEDVHAALAEYCDVWGGDDGVVRIERERWARIAAAFAALYELQGLDGTFEDPGWPRILELACVRVDGDVYAVTQ